MKQNITRGYNRRRAPLRWVGGKVHLVPWLVKLMPEHEIYVAPFGGGGSDIFCKPASRLEVYNDQSRLLTNYFDVIRDARQRRHLCFALQYTPYSRFEFERCLATLRQPKATPVALAHATAFICLAGYGGLDPAKATPGGFRACKTIKY